MAIRRDLPDSGSLFEMWRNSRVRPVLHVLAFGTLATRCGRGPDVRCTMQVMRERTWLRAQSCTEDWLPNFVAVLCGHSRLPLLFKRIRGTMEEEPSKSRPLCCRRSSKCQQDSCVVVTRFPDVIRIGDTKAEGETIEVSLDSWRSFLRGLSQLAG